MRLLRICLKSEYFLIVVVFFIVFLVGSLSYTTYTSANFNQRDILNQTDIPKAEQVGSDIYQRFKETVSGRQNIQSNYMNPLLSNKVPLYTIDRSQSGIAQLYCPSEGEFLTVITQPAEYNNLNVIIFYDSNADGKLDRRLDLGGVSGICANGFFKCENNNINRCKIYVFKFDPSTRLLYVEEVDQTKVGGCFCIMQSCGQNLFWRNVEYSLSTLGGAIVQAFMDVDPIYTVSRSVIEGTIIKFFGQASNKFTGSQGCIEVGGSSQVSQLASLRKKPSLLEDQARNLYAFSSKDNGTPAYYVETMSKNPLIQDTSEFRTCEKKYQVVTRSFNELFSFRGDCAFLYRPAEYCGPNCIQVITPIYQQTGVWSRFRVEFLLPYNYYKSLNKIQFISCSRCHDLYFYLNGQKVYEFRGANGEYWFTLDIPAVNLKKPTQKQAALQVMEVSVYTKIHLGGHKTCEIYKTGDLTGAAFRFIFNDPVALCVPVDEYYDNKCAIYESDSSCILWEEEQDGVKTVLNGVKTGLQPFHSCEMVCNKQVCAIWNIKRTYKCKTKNNMDLTGVQKRLETISGSYSANYGIGQVDYVDLTVGNVQGVTKVVCKKDLNRDGVFQPNEYAECIRRGGHYFCPLDVKACTYSRIAGYCEAPGSFSAALGKCVASPILEESRTPPQCCPERRYDMRNGTLVYLDPPCVFNYNSTTRRCETTGNVTYSYKCSLDNSTYSTNDTCKSSCMKIVGNSTVTGTCNQVVNLSCPEGTSPDYDRLVCYRSAWCIEGSTYDEVTDSCITRINRCPPGYYFEGGVCTADISCGSGTYDPALKACKTDPVCPNPGGKCVFAEGDYYCSSPCVSEVVYDESQVKMSDHQIKFRPNELPDDCEPVCRIKVENPGKDVQVRMEYNPLQRVAFMYRPCEQVRDRYVCPVNSSAGEVIDVDCSCASRFPEAATALQVMRQAARDIVCSSGVEKGLP